MGVITERRRRDYSGLDADKASIPAGGTAVNDTYLATDTKILYFWDGVAWIIIPLDVIVAGMLKTDCVETLKIKNSNVTAAKLATNSVETLKIKDLNVTTGKAALGFGRFVQRLTNAWDKQVGDFITDGNNKVDGLDLSAIVPAGATGVMLRLGLLDNAVDSYLYITHSVGSSITGFRGGTQVANVEIEQIVPIPIDTDRKLDYTGKNLAFAAINLAVVGWFT